MKHLSNCPVCSSSEISFSFEAATNRNSSDPARWKIFKCQSCGHGFINPQPSWQELSIYYKEDYDPYIQNHGAEDENDAEVVKSARASGTFRHLPIPTGKTVLDVGCGAGWFLRICKQLGAETFGIEPSEFGAKRSRADGLEVFNGMVGDYIQHHGTERRFDVITANHVIEHAPDPIKTLEGLKSLLAPGGVLWISVPNAACYFSRRLGGQWHSTDLPYHLQQFSPASIEIAGTQVGLKANRLYTYSLPSATAASLRYLLRKRFLLPQRISMKIDIVNKYGAKKIALNLDRNRDGEAVIVEFGA